jgi:hypothetical protein
VRIALFLLVAVAACSPKPGDIVICHEELLCNNGQEIASESDKQFCTNPDDPGRAGEIDQFQKTFASTCGGAQVTCVQGGAPTCQAKCTIGATTCNKDADCSKLTASTCDTGSHKCVCDIGTAVPVE